MQVFLFVIVGLISGGLGAMVGLGGGVIIVPALTLFCGVPIRQAIAASLVAVIATSITAAIGYVREGFANIRLGMTLEISTSIGGMLGGLTAAALNREVLSGIFGVALGLISGYLLVRHRIADSYTLSCEQGLLGGCYYDPSLGKEVHYRVRRLPVGLLASFIAGNISGLLGVGGGFIKVPTLIIAMGIPVKAAIATSSFMIGITACAGAYIYYTRGMVNPLVAVPVTLGVTAGAYISSRLAPRVKSVYLTIILAIILLGLSIQMLLAAFGINLLGQ